MRNRKWLVELVETVVKDKPTAEMVVDRLMEEGLIHLGYGDADVDKVVTAFTDSFGTTKVSKADRFAARRLVEKYGSQSIVGIVKLLSENSDEQFCPVVNSVYQLEAKLPSILNFLRKKQTSEVIDI